MTTERNRIGNSELAVFPLALGGNVFGWTANEAESFKVLDRYAQAGGNFVDTADSYSFWAPGNEGGESERILGEWMDSRGNRNDIVVATKVSQHPAYKGMALPSSTRGRSGTWASPIIHQHASGSGWMSAGTMACTPPSRCSLSTA